MTERIQSMSAESEYWYIVGLIYSQFEGLMIGYNSAAPASQVRVATTAAGTISMFYTHYM